MGSTPRPSTWIIELVISGRIAMLLVAALPACSGGSSPTTARVGAPVVAQRVGPGGGTLRGDGAGPLEGLEIVIPPGALGGLVEVSIELGSPIDEPGTQPASVPLRIELDPDPGALRRPIEVTMSVDVPTFRTGGDLVVVGRSPAAGFGVPLGGSDRHTLVADRGALERETRRFRFSAGSLGDMQVRLATGSRLEEDALQLTNAGYARLAELTSASVVDADVLFAEAQTADPWAPTANLLRGISRILVAVDDRRDRGPGIDSIGEALSRLGIDVTRESLLSRLQTGNWPRPLRVPAGAPSIRELQGFLRARIYPVFQASLRDLDAVPSDYELLIELPEVLGFGTGQRQFDTADLLALRSVVSGAMFAIDWLDDLQLEADLSLLPTPGSVGVDFARFFTAHPMLGRVESLPEDRTLAALREFAAWARAAFTALDGEDDVQSDDIWVFDTSVTLDQRSRWRANFGAVVESLAGAGVRTLQLDCVPGELRVDLGAPIASGAFEPAFAIPSFLGCSPLAGTVREPELGGLLPGATQDQWSDALGYFSLHVLGDAPIEYDGAVADWPASAEALLPRDPVGDVGIGPLRGVDLERLHLIRSGEDLAFRLGIAADAVGYRVGQSTAYGVRIRDRDPGTGGQDIEVVLHLEAAGVRVVVERGGEPRSVRFGAGLGGSELEFGLNRFDLLDPDEPPADRIVSVWAEARDPETEPVQRDETRGVLVRF